MESIKTFETKKGPVTLKASAISSVAPSKLGSEVVCGGVTFLVAEPPEEVLEFAVDCRHDWYVTDVIVNEKAANISVQTCRTCGATK